MREMNVLKKKVMKHPLCFGECHLTIFLSREIHKTSSTLPCTEKQSEYHTCNECEDEVNRKSHLTTSQEAEFFLQNIYS